jgi:hypothetical protein
MVEKVRVRVAAVAIISAALAACGGDDDPAGPAAVPLTVPKVASCAAGDKPEAALQGQVPAALRAAGFAGFNCNLKLVGQYQGEGGNWSSATFFESANRTCAYHSTAAPTLANGTPVAGRVNPGVPVIDISDRANPTRLSSLTTPAMLDPWESLRVHPERKFLIADNGQNGAGGAEIDIYDLSNDCRAPQLLSSLQVGTGADGGVVAPTRPTGHEGNLAPDGLTYYIGDTTARRYHAIDISNLAAPKLIATFHMETLGLTRVHGLSVSQDGNRMYGTTSRTTATAIPDPNDPSISVDHNGFVVFDTSEVQARLPNAQIRRISTVLYRDGSVSQHTIPIKIGGKEYLVMVDEAGPGGLSDAQNVNLRKACMANMALFPVARIYDMSDEKTPKVVSKLLLETHDPKNCAAMEADLIGLSTFTYGSHYCSVDNRENATALACGYFNSGIRVFDIRDPLRPKEIAYYNPPPATQVPGSNVRTNWRASGPDWCASRVDFDFANKQLITMCQNNGLLVLQFADGVWPFANSTPSLSQN